jgi:hypothetical protein
VIDFDGGCYAPLLQASLAQPVVPAHYSSAISDCCAASLAWGGRHECWNKKPAGVRIVERRGGCCCEYAGTKPQSSNWLYTPVPGLSQSRM